MIINVAGFSYGLAAAMYLMLSLLLVTAWHGRLQGGLLLSASAISLVWCAAQSTLAFTSMPPFWVLQLFELARNGAWFVFLFALFRPRAAQGQSLPGTVRRMAIVAVVVAVALLVVIVAPRLGFDFGVPEPVLVIGNLLGFLGLAVMGVVLVYQLFRDTLPGHRWAYKFLFFGLGGLFVYDLYLYSVGLLFSRLDPASWAARGLVNAIVVPFVAIAARRNPVWSVEVFVSRQVVFHSTALMAVGVYLMLMAAAGYYIRLYGGTWGGAAQVAFIFLAGLLLVSLLVSGQARARLKVLLNKHFFKAKYDYREEWLRFTRTLADADPHRGPRESLIRAFAEIVDSERGVLWARQSSDYFQPVAALNLPIPEEFTLKPDASLARFLTRSNWIIYLDEFQREPGRYEGLVLPDWITELRDPWVIIPMLHEEELLGFIVLTRALTPRELNWEDLDLLKTCGRQAASYLAMLRLSEALADARQFEAFNRVSAFVVHDLKNLAAQLSLVVANAKRHMHSPGFIEDAIDTVDNATAKMNRLLAQLRKDRGAIGSARSLDLVKAMRELVAARARTRPQPQLSVHCEPLRVATDPDRLGAVVEHLVQNAQDATEQDGEVRLEVSRVGDWAEIAVIDTGVGMDATFISERLFRPFDTTKGNAGMGVGVYETRAFALAHGGELRVESTPGRGTVFRLRLPVDGAVVATQQPQSMEAIG